MHPRSETRRQWAVDALLTLAVVAVLVMAWSITQTFRLEGFEPGHKPFGEGRPRMVPLSGLAWVGVALSAGGVAARRTLVGYLVAVAGLAIYLVSGGAPVGAVFVAVIASIGFFRVHELRSRWPWALLLIPAFAAGAPFDLRHWFTVVTMLAWTLLPVGVALAVHNRHAERAQRRRDELERVAHAERLRLARDIHDVVGHSLSLITLQSGVALKVLDDDPAQARESLEAIRATSKDALAEVRRTLGVFREDDAPLAPTPDLGAIAALVDQVRATGVPVELRLDEGRDPVAPSVQAVAHRIVQESLTNALRHAPGARIAVTVAQREESLAVRVHSDRAVTGPIVLGGGLTGMRERVDALGGTLLLDAGADGFTVDALLPAGEAA
ncbi:hypothetical protein BW730_13495 [Tessaracoccus aquimaris]|uniref:histidine kinase n=1 Tax=Tessaracoccus aquimaris TaxID=1332264 RepID=A0A1Q2CQM4_9ACTN|nr:sensor histidine kinase [Tessaracoccus aquimaris]AQP48365.1 hypothetical protein BW730_13495 [Tessaracoccus aquimaris]